MKSQAATAVVLTALFAAGSLAQTVASAPFYLQLQSSNKTLNGAYLGACHEGAAIEGICTGEKGTFGLNTTKGETEPIAGKGYPGVLTYKLVGGNFVESEAMSFYLDPSTNVALPLFEPTYANVEVSFDKSGLLNIQSYLKDTVTPPTAQTPTAYYRWYICESNYEGYVYSTLNWVQGKHPPENPSCQSVQVKRVAA